MVHNTISFRFIIYLKKLIVSQRFSGNGCKKDVRLIALRPHILGIAKRLNQMNYEETIFPRRDIYVGRRRTHTTIIYTQNEH